MNFNGLIVQWSNDMIGETPKESPTMTDLSALGPQAKFAPEAEVLEALVVQAALPQALASREQG